MHLENLIFTDRIQKTTTKKTMLFCHIFMEGIILMRRFYIILNNVCYPFISNEQLSNYLPTVIFHLFYFFLIV